MARLSSRLSGRKWFGAFSTLALAAAIAACSTYVMMPGKVGHDRTSVPYVFEVVNHTGSPFSIEPSAYGKTHGYPDQAVANGASFDVRVQIRSFRAGAADRVGGRQVLDAPYITQEGADTAVIRVRQNGLRTIAIDLSSDEWFAARPPAGDVPLRMVIDDLAPKRWFLSSPAQRAGLRPASH